MESCSQVGFCTIQPDFICFKLSLRAREPTIWGSDTNRPAQSQKQARILRKKRDCTIQCSEIKGTDQLEADIHLQAVLTVKPSQLVLPEGECHSLVIIVLRTSHSLELYPYYGAG